MQRKELAIIVFAKAPVVGRVKTRLAEKTGPAKAAGVYQKLLNNTLETVREIDQASLCCYCDDPLHELFCNWQAKGFKLYAQKGKDLGEKMLNAMLEQQADFSRVILLGSDCPTMSKAIIQSAIDQLDAGKQVVLTPTEDGGFVLIGIGVKPQAGIFEDVAWSTPTVFQQTLANCKNLGLSVGQTGMLWDVDNYKDYLRYLAG